MDWGLGHAARCIPVIKAFRNAGCRVVVASSGPGAELIGREPGMGAIEIVPFPGFSVSYSRYWLLPHLFLQLPSFLYHIEREKKMLKILAGRLGPDLIISDNRYGLFHDSIPSILITHQLRPQLPAFFKPLENSLSAVIKKWAGNFNECWIPDFPGAPASGELVEGWNRLPLVRFTGWLSRFGSDRPGFRRNMNSCRDGERADCQGSDTSGGKRYRYRILFILSGPEPQRSILEKKITCQCLSACVRAMIVRGVPSDPVKKRSVKNLDVVSFLDSKALYEAICNSRLVICRSGYSSVMDLLVLGKRAVLVPTPGQTEQLYLARWLDDKGWFKMITQKDFNIDMVLAMEALPGTDLPKPGYFGKTNMLQECVKNALSDCRS